LCHTARSPIEVALPLEAINAASAREKSSRRCPPPRLNLWWARRPLAACRAELSVFIVVSANPTSIGMIEISKFFSAIFKSHASRIQ